MSSNWLNEIPQNIGWYLAGFADGEGSFNVSLRNKRDYRIRWQVCLTFNVSQRDITTLTKFKRYLSCGTIKRRKDGLYMYQVDNYHMIMEKVLPFFQKYRFLSVSKQYNFGIFSRIAYCVAKGQHLEPDGFTKILHLREKLNQGKGRTRKYHLGNVLLVSPETIRQTPRQAEMI